MAIVSAREVIGIGMQGNIGSEAGEYNIVPVDSGSFSASETYEQILETGRRGTDAMDYNAFQGVGSTEISFDFPMMYGALAGNNNTGSVLGILLRNILGTGGPAATASEGSATAAEQRNACRTEKNGSAKTAFNTWFRLGKAQEYLTVCRNLIGGTGDAHYKGCRVTELTINSNAGEGAVTCSASLTGMTPTVGTGETVVTTKTLSNTLALGYQNTLEATAEYKPYLLGTLLYHADDRNVLNRIISFSVTLSRDASPVYTMSNAKTYNDLYLGPLSVTWNAVAEISNTELAAIRDNTAIVPSGVTKKTIISFSQGTLNDNDERSLLIGIGSSSPYEAPLELDTSGDYATVSISGRALTTNAAMPLSGDDYDSQDATNRSPLEIQITEAGHATGTPPTYV